MKPKTECPTCNKLHYNPKFCSRSCSAKKNNSLYPKRPKSKICKTCNAIIYAGSTYCDACKLPVDYSTYDELTIDELTYKTDQLACNKHTKIRDRARTVYKNSKQKKICAICGYSLHCDICHIKPVSAFNSDAKISEVNHLDNLVSLCKNHHWEFDHGYISEEKLRCLMSQVVPPVTTPDNPN